MVAKAGGPFDGGAPVGVPGGCGRTWPRPVLLVAEVAFGCAPAGGALFGEVSGRGVVAAVSQESPVGVEAAHGDYADPARHAKCRLTRFGAEDGEQGHAIFKCMTRWRLGRQVQGDDLEASVLQCWLDLVASHVEVAT